MRPPHDVLSFAVAAASTLMSEVITVSPWELDVEVVHFNGVADWTVRTSAVMGMRVVP